MTMTKTKIQNRKAVVKKSRKKFWVVYEAYTEPCWSSGIDSAEVDFHAVCETKRQAESIVKKFEQQVEESKLPGCCKNEDGSNFPTLVRNAKIQSVYLYE